MRTASDDKAPKPATGAGRLPEAAVANADIATFEADAIVLNLFEGQTEPTGATAAIDRALGGELSELLATGDFTGRSGDVAVLYPRGRVAAKRVLVTGLGQLEEFALESARRAAAFATKKAISLGVRHLATIVHGAGAGGFAVSEAAQATLEGALLAAYSYGGWRAPKEGKAPLEKVSLVELEPKKLQAAESGAAAAVAIAHGAALARDLVNLPANYAVPAYLASVAEGLAKDGGLRVRAHDRSWAEGEGMGAFLAVAQGSPNEPAFIVMEHNADRTDLPLVALVGKGVTFDTGGLSLKTATGMIPMKGDMAGAAAVIGAMRAVAELDLPLRVMGVAACVENMPDGDAFRPSDVLVSGAGISIEVLSTDAEGRLALADALWYVQRHEPAAVVDIATLTGASVRALGAGLASSLFSNDPAVRARVETAASATGERVWHMPIFGEYRKSMESEVADLKNSGGSGGGGAGQAAAFLEPFTDYPWAHIDMAGMGLADKPSDKGYVGSGATGYGVRLFVEFLRNWA